jgi:hypothetical protein
MARGSRRAGFPLTACPITRPPYLVAGRAARFGTVLKAPALRRPAATTASVILEMLSLEALAPGTANGRGVPQAVSVGGPTSSRHAISKTHIYANVQSTANIRICRVERAARAGERPVSRSGGGFGHDGRQHQSR